MVEGRSDVVLVDSLSLVVVSSALVVVDSFRAVVVVAASVVDSSVVFVVEVTFSLVDVASSLPSSDVLASFLSVDFESSLLLDEDC